MSEEHQKEPNIWKLIGFIMGIYALMILGAGIYYEFRPFNQVRLSRLNPSLWWGAIMAVTSVLLLFFGRKKQG